MLFLFWARIGWQTIDCSICRQYRISSFIHIPAHWLISYINFELALRSEIVALARVVWHLRFGSLDLISRFKRQSFIQSDNVTFARSIWQLRTNPFHLKMLNTLRQFENFALTSSIWQCCTISICQRIQSGNVATT